MQRFLKMYNFYQFKYPLFAASALLLKKGKTLNLCNTTLLEQAQNTYQLNYSSFASVMKTAKKYDLINIFKSDAQPL